MGSGATKVLHIGAMSYLQFAPSGISIPDVLREKDKYKKEEGSENINSFFDPNANV